MAVHEHMMEEHQDEQNRKQIDRETLLRLKRLEVLVVVGCHAIGEDYHAHRVC